MAYPKTSSFDLFHWEALLPLANLQTLSSFFGSPVQAQGTDIITDVIRYCRVQGSQIPALLAIPITEAETGAAPSEAMTFQFRLAPTALPPVLSKDKYVAVRASTVTGKSAVVLFSIDGLGYVPVPNVIDKIRDSATYTAEENTYRIVISENSASLYVLYSEGTEGDQAFILLHEWDLPNVPAPASFQVDVKGTPTDTYEARFSLLAAHNSVKSSTLIPLAVVDGPTESQVGQTVQLDGSGSRNFGAGSLTYRWLFNPPIGSTALLSGAVAALAQEFTAEGYVIFTARRAGEEGNNIQVVVEDPGALGELHLDLSTTQNGVLLVTITLAHNGVAVTTNVSELITALEAPHHPAYVQEVSALIDISGVGEIVPTGSWVLDGGVDSADTVVTFTPDVAGPYMATLYVATAGADGVPAAHVVMVNPAASRYGVDPRWTMIPRQVAQPWWSLMQNRTLVETAWSAVAHIVGDDLLQTIQTRMATRLSRLPRLWRRKWYRLPMRVDFPSVGVALPPSAANLSGAFTPVDDNDEDLWTRTATGDVPPTGVLVGDRDPGYVTSLEFVSPAGQMLLSGAGIPCRTLVDAGNAFGFFPASAGSEDLFYLRYGAMAEDVQAGDILACGQEDTVAVKKSSVLLQMTGNHTYAPMFPWQVHRPRTSVPWAVVGSVALPTDANAHVGDLLELTVRWPTNLTEVVNVPLGGLSEDATVGYFSVAILAAALSAEIVAHWGELTCRCSTLRRVRSVPVSPDLWHVPVVRSTLDFDAPAMAVNEDYTLDDAELTLTEAYTSSNLPPDSLWAEQTLFYNRGAENTFGALLDVELDLFPRKADYAPALQALMFQTMRGPWKGLLKRSLAILLGAPFTFEQGDITEISHPFVTVDSSTGATRVYNADHLPPEFAPGTTLPAHTILDSRAGLNDWIDKGPLWQTLMDGGYFTGLDWLHIFVVSAPFGVSAQAWTNYRRYLERAKPAWQKPLTVVRMDEAEDLAPETELTVLVKKFFFDVPTGLEDVEAPVAMGRAGMLDDGNRGFRPTVTGTATSGSGFALADTSKDFHDGGVTVGWLLVNVTNATWGWIRAVSESGNSVICPYGMTWNQQGPPPPNAQGDTYRMYHPMDARHDVSFNQLRDYTTAQGTNQFTVVVAEVVDFPVDLDVTIGWRVENVTTGEWGVIQSAVGDTLVLDPYSAGMPANDIDQIFHVVPPSGKPGAVLDDLIYLGPMAHADLLSCSWNPGIGAWQDDAVQRAHTQYKAGDEEVSFPIHPNSRKIWGPLIIELYQRSGAVGSTLQLSGAFFIPGATVFSVGGVVCVITAITGESAEVTVPQLDPGVVDVLVHIDGFQDFTWLAGFEVLDVA